MIECIAFSWIYGSIWVIPPLFGWNRFIFEGFGTTCTFDYVSKEMWDRLYVMTLVTGGFFIPLLTIIISYTFILIKLSKRSRYLMNHNNELELQQNSFSSPPNTSTNDINFRSELNFESNQNKITGNLHHTQLRVTRCALLVCAIYCAAWGPYALMTILSQIGFNHIVTAYTTALLGLFTKTAACINPLIYALSSSAFHREICLCINVILPCRRRIHRLPSPKFDENREALNIKINQPSSMSD